MLQTLKPTCKTRQRVQIPHHHRNTGESAVRFAEGWLRSFLGCFFALGVHSWLRRRRTRYHLLHQWLHRRTEGLRGTMRAENQTKHCERLPTCRLFGRQQQGSVAHSDALRSRLQRRCLQRLLTHAEMRDVAQLRGSTRQHRRCVTVLGATTPAQRMLRTASTAPASSSQPLRRRSHFVFCSEKYIFCIFQLL